MNYSLNETEALAKKATRGAGYSWGLAEETAFAVRWLCRHGIDGCGALARWLESIDDTKLENFAPQIGNDNWNSAAGVLCPLMTGATLADGYSHLRNDSAKLINVAEPSLLLYSANVAAVQLGAPISVKWSGTLAVTENGHLYVDGSLDSPREQVIVEVGGAMGKLNTLCNRAAPNPSVMQTLERFAHQTYAPATKESRLTGAGAGLSDND